MVKTNNYLRNITNISIVTLFSISIINIPYIVLASTSTPTSSNSPFYTEPLNYTLSFLRSTISKEYLNSFNVYNYSSYTVSEGDGWIVMNSTNYTFDYLGDSHYNNFTFNTICLENSTYHDNMLEQNFYNVSISSIPTSNGMDSVARITHIYRVVNGISASTNIFTTTEFYWFNYTKNPIGSDYNITFNASVEGIRAKGFVVEDPGNTISLLGGSINMVDKGSIINASINDGKVSMKVNGSDPITFDPITVWCTYHYPGGYAFLLSTHYTIPTTYINLATIIINSILSVIGGSSIVSALISCYISYYISDYDNFANSYSNNGNVTLYLTDGSSYVNVFGFCISTGVYMETGVYYNQDYMPFTNTFTLFLVPNYNYGIFLYEQPHSSIAPPSPYTPPWYAFW